MDKRVKRALLEIKQQHDQYTVHTWHNAGWKATTASIIKMYASDESEFNQEYEKWRKTIKIYDEDYRFYQRQEVIIKNILGHLSQHIERYGLYRLPKRKKFTPFADWQTGLAIVSISAILVGGGYQLGIFSERSNNTKQQLRNEAELDSFKRGLKLFIPAVVPLDTAQNKAKNKTDLHKKQDSIRTN